jgi:hypothetical protein
LGFGSAGIPAYLPQLGDAEAAIGVCLPTAVFRQHCTAFAQFYSSGEKL